MDSGFRDWIWGDLSRLSFWIPVEIGQSAKSAIADTLGFNGSSCTFPPKNSSSSEAPKQSRRITNHARTLGLPFWAEGCPCKPGFDS